MDINKAELAAKIINKINNIKEKISNNEAWIKMKYNIYVGMNTNFISIECDPVEIFEYVNRGHRDEIQRLKKELAEL